ncbi:MULTISPECIES: DUF1905 domain-containing protein [unclassified Nonomuraea]|uniref:DUF1905 domain-containing protein n=1 Tax=unclassified Nonomuraea TaxID=2593643 RepID=UPI00191C4951|nr:DUF1905 domain-containing protein [Nonomuraea sp. KC401]
MGELGHDEPGVVLATRSGEQRLDHATRKLAFTADIRARIGKQAGDTVTVTLDERIAR